MKKGRLKNIIQALIVVPSLIAVFFVLHAQAEQSAGQPRLHVRNPSFDFATVNQGDRVVHDYEVRNTGDAPLTIHRVQTTCGCTAAIPDKNVLDPGESAFINVAFDTSGFHGYKVKTTRVYTDDPTNISSVLTLQGTIKADVDINPSRLFFGRINKGDTKSVSTKLLLAEDSKTKILDVSSKSDDIELLVEDVTHEGRQGKKITATLKDSIPVGVFRSRIVIKTTSQSRPVLNLPVFARIEGDLKLAPTDVSFGLLEGPLVAPESQVVELMNDGSNKVNIISATSSSPDVEAKVETVKEGRKYNITVTIAEGTIGTLRTSIDVITDHPDSAQSKLSLPVYGIITKKRL
jgi:hypothetical protein